MTGIRRSAVLEVVPQVRYRDETPIGRRCWVWCPGCEAAHAPQIAGEAGDLPEGPCWDWDGNVEQPTFSPSLLVHGPTAGKPEGRCHSFIRAGRWEFLTDSDHALAGQTVSMVDLPDWLRHGQGIS